MLKRTLIVLFLAVMAIPVVASPCWACSCVSSSDDPAEHRRAQAKSADLVFTGVAKGQKVSDEGDPEFEGDETIATRFRVGRTYKGHPGRWVTVSTHVNGATCGYDFDIGKRYTVFAYEQRDGYTTSLCSGTKQGRINPERYGFDD